VMAKKRKAKCRHPMSVRHKIGNAQWCELCGSFKTYSGWKDRWTKWMRPSATPQKVRYV
jgi:hypothetical protein